MLQLRINKLVFENIRSHELSDVKIHDGITIFTGRTGSGKSSILIALEYALFGSESGISNSAIMRRGKQTCKVELEFNEDGDNYKIIRGLKKSGTTITTDVNNMKILKNGSIIPLIGRATDLNEKIIEILGYPNDVKPKELFEITSYTKQDEIRSIIELSAEKRQDYIDKILQLAKYKQTWENMKELIDFFGAELLAKSVRLENYERLQKEILDIEKRVIDLNSKIKLNEKELSFLKENYNSTRQSISDLEQKYRGLLEKRRSYDQLKGSELSLKRELDKSKELLANLLSKKSAFDSDLSNIGVVSEFEELQSKNIELLKTEELLEKEFSKIKNDFNEIKRLGKGKCPTCKQEVTEKHIHDLEKEFSKLQEKLRYEIDDIKKNQKELGPLIINSKKKKDIQEQLERIQSSISERKSHIENTEKELKEITSKIEMPDGIGKISDVEKELNSIKKQETELFSKIQSITRENSILNSEIEDRKKEFSQKGSELVEMEKNRSELQNLEQTIQILSRMREDIRNIREIIRNNFLEDFKQEFQKKFEEIRKYEEEYSVDIKNDYEPIAFSLSGEEVPITNLSGGEKTSVALAYRLSLANLSAQISAIKPSEILILDEPTVGFDQEDIKALPTTLKNIKTIPQIIIVTHEEELKNAADYKFEVKKVSGKSVVTAI